MSNLMDKLDLLKSLGDNVSLSDVVKALEARLRRLTLSNFH
jgi:hypothetical protein